MVYRIGLEDLDRPKALQLHRIDPPAVRRNFGYTSHLLFSFERMRVSFAFSAAHSHILFPKTFS